MPQQESKQLLTSTHQVHGRIHSRTNKVTEGFVCGVWDPHRRQVTGAVQDCQLLRVAPIGLDPLAWLAWNQ